MKTDLVVYRVKRGKEKTLFRWGSALMGKHKRTALSTMREEGAAREGFHLVQIGTSWYAIGLSDYKDVLSPANPKRALNRKHRAVLHACLERPAWKAVRAYDLFVP